MFVINLNAEIVTCILSFRKSRHKLNLESTSKYGFSPDLAGKNWRRSEHAHASYPGLFFRPPGFSPHMGREERRVQGLDQTWVQGFTALCISTAHNFTREMAAFSLRLDLAMEVNRKISLCKINMDQFSV